MIVRKKCSAVQAAQASVGGGVISLSSESYNIGSSVNGSGSNISPIGRPIFCLNGEGLESNEIWLEGQEVSKTEYSLLYDVYGDTYGTPTDSNNFLLPDWRNRTLWGSEDGTFGYIEAGLPNIEGVIHSPVSIIGYGGRGNEMTFSGAFSGKVGNTSAIQSNTTNNRNCYEYDFDASRSNPIYGNSDTVQPPSVKVRVKTRYK